MLRLSDISYSVEGRPLIEHASAVIPTGHKVGLVGRNGTGKTTLFRLIRGELTLETGSIELPRGARIGGVAQEAPGNEVSLLDTVMAADTERAALLAEAEVATDPGRIAEVQTRLSDIDAWSAEARASAILRGLGFETEKHVMPCSAFSGGWRMRVALAAVLFAQPDLLLLDEPTNYLDLEGALWLENYLTRYPHTVIIVSHDRALLNRSVGAILHLEDRKLTLYQGPYDTFAETRAARIAAAESERKRQEARRAHLQSYVDRFRYKADKARQAQSRLKAIARLKPIATPQEAALRRFTFPEPEELSPPIIATEGAAIGYGETTILSRLSLRIDQDDRIALLGKNGEGKSTLSKFLAGRLEAQKGRINRAGKLRVGYFAQHQVDELYLDETPLEHLKRLRPEETPAKLRSRLGGFGIGAEQADTVVEKLSGGQKARLSLMLATLDAPHLLILDEPTNHLDIESREALVEALTAYTGAVILVSHDLHLLTHVADRLWLVSDGRVLPYDEDLDAYRKMLLDKDKPERSKAAAKPERVSQSVIQELRSDVRKCEQRMEKLEEMRSTLSERLADPAVYDAANKDKLDLWQAKFAEVEDALERAETLWMDAVERLESAS
ncbi:ABC-F family ATP-binding cassette domain-containing protein [Aliiruegeria sabulilitoris]|uniref:ABC-F family ATP-binding cassette domain-containing protein n=1 Tax=Aliiruegeria sabulilitoris TaxID=1510458 RepID=UPI000832EE21|nr:ABC-F family ATP-binding cassette domain-containing protein [Aliiruegeria sabulilitoris]NDR56083.1 ABC-F family ATP-binding cassette domain-containing protein [Pseudoruegeria sp. M32A2M]